MKQIKVKYQGYTDTVVGNRRKSGRKSFFHFMEETIVSLRKAGQERTGETYLSALKSIRKFRENKDIPLWEFDSELMRDYEVYLKRSGLTKNTSSFYMRILRAVYNRMVEQGLAVQRYPFKYVYTGVDKTVKRAISIDEIRKIRELSSLSSSQEFAKDMFLFSFYMRGMSFVDMAYLEKNALRNGSVVYKRRKTGQRLVVKWETCMDEILKKYPCNGTKYLLPIITDDNRDERVQYLNTMHLVNRKLKEIAGILQFPFPLTMYVSRHSWASIAENKNIPIAVISEGMGHDSERTTQIYLASLENSVVDDANKLILDEL